MGVKVKTKVNKFPEINAQLKALNGKKVEVGVFGGENAYLAGIHEYGCRIEVTDKMRAFLHRNGLHLKKDTKYITIPERSFLRAGHDQHIDSVMKKADIMLGMVADGKISAQTALEALGLDLSSKIRDYAVDLDNPANHPFTTERKGSSNPLVDIGGMVTSITYRIREE